MINAIDELVPYFIIFGVLLIFVPVCAVVGHNESKVDKNFKMENYTDCKAVCGDLGVYSFNINYSPKNRCQCKIAICK